MSEATKTKKPAKKAAQFSAEEKAAMKERAKELKAEANKADGEKALKDKIAEMVEPDRTVATRVHEIVTANAPNLMPKTWYGMPAYANKDGKIVCFFQSGKKFETRYSTLGFTDSANLDDGDLYPVSYALFALTPAVEKKIAALVKQAVS